MAGGRGKEDAAPFGTVHRQFHQELHLCPRIQGQLQWPPEKELLPSKFLKGGTAVSQATSVCLRGFSGEPRGGKTFGLCWERWENGLVQRQASFLIADAHALRTPADLGAAQAAETGRRALRLWNFLC